MKGFYSNIVKLTIFFSFLFLANSFSQNINDALRLGFPGLGANARALGMGNAYLGLSDDASAAFFNPAGYGLLKRLELSGGIEYTNFKNNVDFLNSTSKFDNSNTNLNRISFAFPFPTIKGSLVFALSYNKTKNFNGGLKFDGFNSGNTSLLQDFLNTNIPYDLYLTDSNNVTPISGRLNQSGDITTEGSLNNWTFSGAIEAAKNFFIGANLNIHSGSFKSINDYYEDDTQNIYQGVTAAGEPQTTDFQTFYLNRIIDWNISGWDAKVGMLYQFNNYGRLGFTIQFPKTFSIKEKFLVDGMSQFGTGQVYNLNSDKYSDQVQYDIVTPFEIGGGFSANFQGLIFSAEGTLVDYSQLKFDNGDGISQQYIESQNKDIKDKLTAIVNYNLGIEYTIPNVGLRLRTGFFVQPSAYKDDPSEYNRKYFTAGLGFLAEETIGIDAAFAHGWWKDIGDNYGSNVSRTFQDISDNHFMFTVTYRF
ncbi:MAG: hypothetical protein ABI550_06380 [Ignavibacteriaceae bacterium]